MDKSRGSKNKRTTQRRFWLMEGINERKITKRMDRVKKKGNFGRGRLQRKIPDQTKNISKKAGMCSKKNKRGCVNN